MFTVKIEKINKKLAFIRVTYTPEGHMIGATRISHVRVLFGTVEDKARATANQIIDEWRKELAGKKEYITYQVKA